MVMPALDLNPSHILVVDGYEESSCTDLFTYDHPQVLDLPILISG
jgi:hypothetical protein